MKTFTIITDRGSYTIKGERSITPNSILSTAFRSKLSFIEDDLGKTIAVIPENCCVIENKETFEDIKEEKDEKHFEENLDTLIKIVGQLKESLKSFDNIIKKL